MLLRDLQAASFKGARFLVPEDEAEEGRNHILHRYPDSNILYAEDNGGLAPVFKIHGLVHGNGLAGQVAALRRAFTSPGPGVLKHPWYGTQFVAVDQSIRFSRQDRQGGVVEFDVTLVVTGPPVFPGIASGVPAVVGGLSARAVTAAYNAFARSLGVSTSANSTIAVAAALTTFSDVLNDNFGEASGSAQLVGATPRRYVALPDQLGSLLDNAVREPIDDLSITSDKIVAGFRDLGEASELVWNDATAINATTPDLVWRKGALQDLAQATEAAAFAGMAEGMAARAYDTADELERDEALLIARYEALADRDLDDDLSETLGDIVTATSEVLRDVEVRLPRITTVDLAGLETASTLSYLLYENPMRSAAETEAYVDRLVKLNINKNPSALTGEINVLTDPEA